MALADHVVVNDDLDRTVDEMLAIIEASGRPLGLTAAPDHGRRAPRGSGRTSR